MAKQIGVLAQWTCAGTPMPRERLTRSVNLNMELPMRWISFIAGVSLLAAVAGCSNHQQTQKEKVTKQWYAARADVNYSMASQQFESGDLDNSRKSVNEALKLQPTHAPALILSAKLNIEQGQLDQAER